MFMHYIGRIAGALALFVAAVGPLVGGLYNPAEPAGVPGLNFRKLQETLIDLNQIVNEAANTVQRRRYELIASLATRAAPASLPVEQRLELSTYLVRLGRFRDAVNLLAPAQFQERDNFLVLSNLATAEQLDGKPLRAYDYLAAALRLWPKEWSALPEARRTWLEKQIGWEESDFRWYREVETYQLKLLRLRSKEALLPAGELPQNVDGIFDNAESPTGKLQFVGPSGKFEAGKIAPDQQAKLPKNAIEIVEQLLIWMQPPFDYRLYWLLGELFNAEGDVSSAQKVFKEIAGKWAPKPDPNKAGSFSRTPDLPALFKEHLEILGAQAPAREPQPAPADVQQLSPRPPVDWKAAGVGFGGGMVVAFLLAWQLRESRRRRTTGTSPPGGPV
jgi:tetratricopeptide (TPR) repeat protein